MTTFVMPNSYCIDGEFGFDGESMGDWHTGSGAVLIKDIIKYGFGVEPMLDNIKICPAGYFPSDRAEIVLFVGNKRLTVKYENHNSGTRHILIDGKEAELGFDPVRNTRLNFTYKVYRKDQLIGTDGTATPIGNIRLTDHFLP
jgi:cellobiose phosphorylase